MKKSFDCIWYDLSEILTIIRTDNYKEYKLSFVAISMNVESHKLKLCYNCMWCDLCEISGS